MDDTPRESKFTGAGSSMVPALLGHIGVLEALMSVEYQFDMIQKRSGDGWWSTQMHSLFCFRQDLTM